MTDNIGELRNRYRDIEAPPHVATRIRAEVADKPLRTRSWTPAGATIMAVVLVAWLVPYLGENPTTPSTRPTKPSLTALVALKPDAPAHTSVSLSQLKTMKKPKLPQKPRLKPTKPQTNLESESDLLEEKNYVLS